MKRNVETITTIDLGHDQMWLIESPDGARVRVLLGGVWLTEEGSPRDTVLSAGDELALRPDGRAVVEALHAARIELARPRLERMQGAIGRLMRRLRYRVARWRNRMQLGAAGA